MNNFKFLFLTISCAVMSMVQLGCSAGGGSGGGSGASAPLGAAVYWPATLSADNIIPMSVGACGVNGYENEPCISVKICEPGTANCQTISNILVDTGSYGLRIFSSLISVNLTQIQTGGKDVAACVGYLDGSGQWGPVKKADVVLGNKTASNVPVHVLDASYFNSFATSNCASSPDASPAAAGFNGIIGVGAFAQDCSVGGVNDCILNASNGTYYKCTAGGTCTGTALGAANQVTNPVALMPAGYNNGVILKLPDVASTGSLAAYGYLVLGIGSDSTNDASGLTYFPVSQQGYFKTTFNGTTYSQAFIDSGSNFLFFPKISSLPYCSGSTTFFCPSSAVSLTGTMAGSSGATTLAVDFSIEDANYLVRSGNMAYKNIGGDIGVSMFDWGLPFFLGRSVFVGINGTSATVNGGSVTGPYWAF